MNIQDAIEEIRNREKVVERPEIKVEEEVVLTENEKALVEKIDALKELGDRQAIHIENLEDMNEEALGELEKLRNANKQSQDLRRERAIKNKDDELRFLRGKVKKLDSELSKVKGIIIDLKRMIVMSTNRIVVPMKVVFDFSREGIEKTIERVNIEPFEVVLLVDPSGGGMRTAEMLIEREVKAVVCAKNNISNIAMEAFLKADVPVLFQMPVRQIDDIAVTYYDELEQAIKEWGEERQQILGEKTEDTLGELITEYKSRRRKELEQIYRDERRPKEKIIPRKPIKTIESKDIDEE